MLAGGDAVARLCASHGELPKPERSVSAPAVHRANLRLGHLDLAECDQPTLHRPNYGQRMVRPGYPMETPEQTVDAFVAPLSLVNE